ncbi:hypothetical protein LINGRAHAP2_LOCUS34751 [Linum grandiflorum]
MPSDERAHQDLEDRDPPEDLVAASTATHAKRASTNKPAPYHYRLLIVDARHEVFRASGYSCCREQDCTDNVKPKGEASRRSSIVHVFVHWRVFPELHILFDHSRRLEEDVASGEDESLGAVFTAYDFLHRAGQNGGRSEVLG